MQSLGARSLPVLLHIPLLSKFNTTPLIRYRGGSTFTFTDGNLTNVIDQ